MQLNRKRWRDEYSVLWHQNDADQIFLDAEPVLAVLGVVCKLVTLDELRDCSVDMDLLMLSGVRSESECSFHKDKFRRVCFAPMFSLASELVEYLVELLDELDAVSNGSINVDSILNKVECKGAIVQLSAVEAGMLCHFLLSSEGVSDVAEFRSLYPKIFRNDVNVRVYISKLRQKLKPINLEITALPRGRYKIKDPLRRLKFIMGREV